ncbi:MAG: protein-export chaperone SecB [Alphaproteobacteria bacterium]|nr:protein-export chaperone SecB [Alphaproteobacteria bacterium]
MAKAKNTNSVKNQNPIASLPLQVHGQYIKDLSFETPGPFHQAQNESPSLKLNVEVRVKSFDENNFEVELQISAEATQKAGRLYLLELCYAGVFGIGELPQEAIRPLLLIECPRLLFPYARAIISEITRDGGFPPLSIAPVDFAEIYRQQGDQVQQFNSVDNDSTSVS